VFNDLVSVTKLNKIKSSLVIISLDGVGKLLEIVFLKDLKEDNFT
jgi:hypothetical protein